MGLGSEKAVIAYKTLLIIAETDALEIPKLFVVFLWLFDTNIIRHLNLDRHWPSEKILFLLQIWVQFGT